MSPVKQLWWLPFFALVALVVVIVKGCQAGEGKVEGGRQNAETEQERPARRPDRPRGER